MTIYLIKMILCTAIFYSLYALAFQNEKMMKFNRFYLLTGLLVSFVIPLVTVTETVVIRQPIVSDIIANDSVLPHQAIQSSNAGINLFLPFSILYLTVSLVLMGRFVLNLVKIRDCIRCNGCVYRGNIKIVLLKKTIVPHSFLNNIFLDKKEFEAGKIEDSVLAHETAHVRQKHSLDILFIELLQIFTWFNPLLYLYKRALKINHELLADDAAAKELKDSSSYQFSILQRSSGIPSLPMSSAFNFIITKKRLTMLQKQRTPQKAFFKSLLILPVLAGLVIVFHQKSYAVRIENVAENEMIDTPSINSNDSSLLEYEKLLDKYDMRGTVVQSFTKKRSKVISDDFKKMVELFLQLTAKQREKNLVSFIKSPLPAVKQSITSDEIEKWKNGKIYGVWIDGKRVRNSALDLYNGADFSHVFVSKLSKNAINYGKHYYQVDLMTNKYYDDYYEDAMAKKDSYIMVLQFRLKVK